MLDLMRRSNPTEASNHGSSERGDRTTEGVTPLVTAVITTYDRPGVAKRAIESAVDQSYEPIELMVVEDGTDSGIKDWLDSRGYDDVTYISHDENRGLAAARNTAIERAAGEYLAFLDDDDEWKPTRIERQIELVERLTDDDLNHLGVVYCAVESKKDGKVATIIPPENEGNLREAITRDGISTLQSSCLFSKAALEDVGGYDETLQSSIDHDIWMALATHGYHAFTVDEPLVISHDEFGDSMMTDTERRIEGVRAFVEKWRPTFHEWFGPEAGDQWAQRYFVDVIARLAAAKFVTGQFSESLIATRAIQDGCDEILYTTWVILLQLFEAALKRWLPPRLLRLLSAGVRRYDAISVR